MDLLSFFSPHPNFAPGTSLDHATNGHSLSSAPSFLLAPIPSWQRKCVYTSYRPDNRPDPHFLFPPEGISPPIIPSIWRNPRPTFVPPLGSPPPPPSRRRKEARGRNRGTERGGKGGEGEAHLRVRCHFIAPLGRDGRRLGGRGKRERESDVGEGTTVPLTHTTREGRSRQKSKRSKLIQEGGKWDGETTTWK